MSARMTGLHPATVTDIDDQEHQGRVRVRLAWLDESDDGVWARVAMPMAGDGRGLWFMPEVDDEVVVGFNNGDPARPYVVGAVWNGVDRPPVPTETARRIDAIRTAGGSVIEFDDDGHGGSITIATETGPTVRLDGQSGQVRIGDDSGTVVTIESGRVQITAPVVQVDTALARFSGVVQTDTLIANTVVAAAYTPGAGNLM